jgi:tetratricopeptide (TPR) repeat protein
MLALLLIGSMPANGTTSDGLPSPLTGPGVPQLKKSERRSIEKALKQLDRGRPDAAVKAARKAGSNAAASLLQVQIALAGGRGDQLSVLQQLVTDQPGYAAAWATLTVVTEAEGNEAGALESARRVADLWPGSQWAARADELGRLWIDDRVTHADELLARGQVGESMAELSQALALDPTNQPGLMLRAHGLFELGRLEESEAVLDGLEDGGPEALLLLAKIAERQGNWLAAMERYSGLPEDTPGRDAALRRAQIKWRLSVLPAHVQAAMSSTRLTRVELAALMVALVPELEAIGGGRVPLLSDIVDLPSQREIVTAVRLELMEVDQLEHRFYPGRELSEDELKIAVVRLADLLDVASPKWCDPLRVLSSCLEVSVPIAGEAVAEIVIGLVYGAPE